MSDLTVLGTDTDTGKTTFALLWLTAFADRYAYWKPVETGPSDTDLVRRLVAVATILDPFVRFTDPVAPPLAARRDGRSVPLADEIAQARPSVDRSLLIETFGSPLSPLNEGELQIELVRRLGSPCVLVTSSAVGAVGRALGALRVLKAEGLAVRAVVLIGPADEYAQDAICRHGRVPTHTLCPPAVWDTCSIVAAVAWQRAVFEALAHELAEVSPVVASIDLIVRDNRSVWHPYTSLRDPDPPLPIVAAHDEFLELADGRRLIDGTSSWWTILHGHRPPRLMDALRRASETIDHVLFAGVTHPFAVDYAQELLKRAPWPGGRVFFSDNGSTAVEVALKMAYQVWCHRGEPQRTLFVGFDGGYHGDTFGSMAVGRDPVFFGRFEPLLFRAERIPISPDRLDDLLTARGSEVAAVIVEPLVQGAGGMRMHSPTVLHDLCAAARRHGVLFIADEVMTCARIDTFWAHSQAGIQPDLICAAKTLAGGVLPLAVTLCGPDVVSAFDSSDRSATFFHGHSFTAHPLACAVALENLRWMNEGTWQAESARIARTWREAMPRIRDLAGMSDVRASGTVLAVEIDAPGGYLSEAARAMRAACVECGVLVRPLGNVLYAIPPLCTSDASLARVVAAMEAAVLAVGK